MICSRAKNDNEQKEMPTKILLQPFAKRAKALLLPSFLPHYTNSRNVNDLTRIIIVAF